MSHAVISRRHSFSRVVMEDDDAKKIGTLASLPAYYQTYQFEISNEVVNKIGGIHTVIRSKASVTAEEIDYRYFMIGVLKERTFKTEVDVTDPPTAVLGKSLAEMRASGFNVAYGRWLTDGYPQVILFDLGSAAFRLDDWKRELWDSSNIGIHAQDQEANDAVIFGALVADFLAIFSRNLKEMEPASMCPIVAHFHEWMSGVGLMLCRTRHLEVATVFTTHATLLGRYLCAGSVDFYNNLAEFDVDLEAGQRNIYNKYCMERAATHCAHVFTTVSDITGLEAQHLLKRQPDVITPNGLNVVKFAALHEFQNRHACAKDKIHRFVQGHFYGHYDFDLDKTLYLFIAGRYEFGNKGADIFIEALARLNGQLRAVGSDVTVVAFIIFPGQTNNFNVESFRAQAIVKQLRDTVDTIQKEIGHRLFEVCLRGQLPNGDDILNQEDKVKLKRCLYAAQRQELPPICTHNIVQDGIDPVLCNLRRCQLFNHHHDRVKVIFHPEFLNSSNPLLPMDYEEFVRGCHLGVFPSYYEPWGYTPAECTVMGIPSITTNLSGFGCFIQTHVEDPSSYGIYIVDRRFRSSEESVNQLTQYMFNFCQLNRRKRIILRNRCERLSELLDWRNLVVYYKKARLLALSRQYPHWFDLATASRDDRDERGSVKSLHVSRPGSAPSSPPLSRSSTPIDNEEDSEADDIDDEGERVELGLPNAV